MQEKFVITEIKRVIMVGKEEYPEQTTSFHPNLSCNELIFHFSGHDTVFFGNEVLETAPNTVRFLPKGNASRYDVLRHERGECIDVTFDADRPISPRAFLADGAKNEKIGALFKRLFATWVGKSDGHVFASFSLLYQIFAELQRESPVSHRHRLRIKPALDRIHDRFLQEPLSIPALAALCGMKESYFQRLFKEVYGMSPKKYVIGLKINHACELLRLDRYSVGSVAELCNFSDVYFFSRQFKEYVGLSPTAFAEKYRSSK